MAKAPTTTKARQIRCAVYTRKSTEEGLEQEFNSLDAQRESGESYIASMKHEGWICLPEMYDDGGFTGGNMERPALQRLMADIEAGKIDCVVVYKVDRLSRSLLDFARMMSVFEKHQISFVSVTQQFNTSHSMGRLMLNVLLSFAQFERELISERTRDKIAMARKRGKFIGGRPVLGYDLRAGKLTLVPKEAERVRAIFDLYLKTKSISLTAQELNARGWTCKVWSTLENKAMGGGIFTKTTLHRLLSSVIYVGKVPYKGELFHGEHPAIVDEDVFAKTQRLLKDNAVNGGMHARNKHGGLLKGLVHCAACDHAMTHAFAVKEGGVTYRYYACQTADVRGKHARGTRSVPAEEIEKFVADKLAALGADKGMATLVFDAAREVSHAQVHEREQDLLIAERHVARLVSEERDAAKAGNAAVLADVVGRLRNASAEAELARKAVAAAKRRLVARKDVERALADFPGLWNAMTPSERAAVLRLVIRRIDLDITKGSITIEYHDGVTPRERQEEQAA